MNRWRTVGDRYYTWVYSTRYLKDIGLSTTDYREPAATHEEEAEFQPSPELDEFYRQALKN